ncbi:MAG: glycosyltransferase [Bacteroidales bacterium]|jgi:glycosyltransferase involved in cell wall biosynthesis|nr:glycosyltransferase [Bacteroidales bacterium]
MSVIDNLLLVLGGVLLGCLLVQLLFYWVIFSRFAFNRLSKRDGNGCPGVSVVICVKNDCSYLEQFLPFILTQDYPDYEVIIVNDNSNDDTEHILREMQQSHKHLHVISIATQTQKENDNKLALAVGIRSAKNDLILMTNANCQPRSSSWIRELAACSTDKKTIVLGYRTYNHRKGLLNILVRFDGLYTALQYFSFTLTAFPYMGTKSNMLYSKEMFLQNNDYLLAYKMDAGENDLFISKMMNKHNTTISYSYPSQVIAAFHYQSFFDWINRKKKHVRAMKYAKQTSKFFLHLYWYTGLLFYILLVVTLLLSANVVWGIGFLLGVYFIRLFSQWLIFAKACNKLNEKQLIKYIPLMDIFFMFLIPLINVLTSFQKQSKWK